MDGSIGQGLVLPGWCFGAIHFQLDENIVENLMIVSLYDPPVLIVEQVVSSKIYCFYLPEVQMDEESRWMIDLNLVS